MATMTEVEKLTAAYAGARAALSVIVSELSIEIDAAKRARIKAIRASVARALDAKSELHAAIKTSAELFEKPRTRSLHGVKIGFRKGNGSIEWDDEESVIKRIRAKLPEEQAELLIRKKESVYKEALDDLTADDLKRIGVRVEGGGDVVVIKDTAGEVDKLVAALLKEEIEE
jgi:hypothetical protein